MYLHVTGFSSQVLRSILLKLEKISQLSMDLGTLIYHKMIAFLFTAIFEFFINPANTYYLTLIAVCPVTLTSYSTSP